MSYTIVGLFASQDQAKAVSESLEKKGFKNSDYIIYLSQNKPVSKSFWSKIFTDEIDQEATSVDSLITSVAINNETESQLAKDAFNENKVINTYELQEVDFAKAVDLDYIKKVVALKAKALIYAMPEIRTSHTGISIGINSEVSSNT
ncbi:hypothetical protein [Cloacibacterium sp. TD35]|uniref:hypothetical protein n=1 Tax=Cloacibacterium sp. TD35 TaxID=2976818 RepID=UPI00237DE7DF|nr:hypothetical protein [Cloacibacterium sp. TD35]WDT67355.1 hypothetical protein N7277_08435 [Cloacibacterium sp. TD35]